MRPLESPPSKVTFVENGLNSASWYNWFASVYRRMTPAVLVTAYPVASLTGRLSAQNCADSTYTSILFVPDATGGATIAFSDGSDWISVKTGNPV